MSTVKDTVMALLGAEEPPPEPIPVAPAVEIEVLICPHCECPDCEVWSTTEARMANCPECGAEFSAKVFESASKTNVIQIAESRAKMRQRIAPKRKSEIHRFLQ